MMDSEQHTYVQAESDDAQSMLWSPTRPGDHSSQAKGVHSGGSWKTLVDPILPELLQAHEEFAAALEADGDNVTSLSGSSGHDDQGVVVSNLKKALPILLQENTTFRERLYSQSDFEPSASPAAENLHDKILHDQFRPYKKRISRLPLDRVHHSRSHQLAHMPKSPPQSPPFRLPHFGSLATLAPEDAPLLPKFQNESGQRNIQLLHAMRRNEVLADPTFTAPPPSRPRLPETASANEIVFLLRTQAQRRRKQVHDERIGQSMFPGQERRAVRRRMKHVSLGKDNDVWPPSTSPSPPLEYSAVDEAAITVLVVSPARLCPECKVLKTGQISELDNATARVERFLSDQDSLGALIPKGQTMPQISSPFSETIPGDKSTNVYREAVSTSSGRSVYLHPNTSIDRNLVSSARIQASPTLGCHKARAASIDIIEQFCAPAPAKPKAEPTKRVSPLKHRVAGFEEHSKRGLKRKQRPESLTNCSTACTTTKVLRPPLSPCSRNAGASIGRGLGHRNGVPTSCSPPDVSRTEVPRNSWSSLHIAPMPDSLDRENRHSETEDEAQAQFSPAYSVSSQPSLINSPTHSPGQKPWNYEFSVGSHVTVPVPTPGIPSMPRSSFTQSLQGHRGGPVVFTEEGLGKAILYSSNRDSNHEASKEKSPSSGSIDSLKAKEYLRHLNEHVENLCRERDQAVLSVETLHNEVMILKETVNVLKYDLNRWKRSKAGRR